VRALTLLAAAALLQGCALTSHFAYTNERLTPQQKKFAQASFEIVERPAVKKRPNVLVLLALSGGGSRAGYFSARTMLALERLAVPGTPPTNVLNEVDLISSVSGGSLAAAYYASSVDPGPQPPAGRRVWDERTVADLFGRNYIARWIGNWLWHGIYWHGNHHQKTSLFNPGDMDKSLPVIRPGDLTEHYPRKKTKGGAREAT